MEMFKYFAQMNYRIYRETPNISHTSVGNKMFDYSDVVGAAPISSTPTTLSFLV